MLLRRLISLGYDDAAPEAYQEVKPWFVLWGTRSEDKGSIRKGIRVGTTELVFVFLGLGIGVGFRIVRVWLFQGFIFHCEKMQLLKLIRNAKRHVLILCALMIRSMARRKQGKLVCASPEYEEY